MTMDERDAAAAEALVAFLKVLALTISALDEPQLAKPTAHGFMLMLDHALGDPQMFPGELGDRVRLLREMLGKYVTGAVEFGALARDADAAFREVSD